MFYPSSEFANAGEQMLPNGQLSNLRVLNQLKKLKDLSIFFDQVKTYRGSFVGD